MEAQTQTKRRTYTIGEAAVLLGMSKAHAYNHADQIPGLIKIGERYVVSREILDKFLADPKSVNS